MRTPLAIAAALALAACSDPAADKTAAKVVEPVAASATPAPAPTTAGEALAAAGTLGFTGAKVTKSHVGVFSTWTGSLRVDGETLVGADFEVTVASLATDAVKLDNHLRSPDFFDVGLHPTASFRSTEIRAGAPAGSKLEGANTTVVGDLTIRGVTKRIEVPAVVTFSADQVAARSEFSLDRHDFGIVYPGKPDDLIRDEVALRVDVTAPRSTAAQVAPASSGTPSTTAPAAPGAGG